MTPSFPYKTTPLLLGALAIALMAHSAEAQNLVQGYTFSETQSTPANQYTGNNLIFGVAAYQMCQIKNFFVMTAYILAAIAFVVFAIRALFTKFQFNAFFPVIAGVFIIAFSDLFIAFIAPQAWYCPTVISQL